MSETRIQKVSIPRMVTEGGWWVEVDRGHLMDTVTGLKTGLDWKCPTCGGELAKIEGSDCTCVNGHRSQ